MKVSYKVLQKYIPDLDKPEKVASDLIMHTAEVEEIIYEGSNLSHVFIGEVLECIKHPDSDKLNLCKVFVSGEEKQIVCGAPNVRAGIKVPVAVVGAKLSADFEIKKTKIRGEVSEGMICSEDELGLTKERQTGIMILDDDAKIGDCIKDYLGLDGVVLEIDNKAINHRPDLFSHIGIAREISAINGKKFDFEYEDRDFSDLSDLGIKNEIPELVRRYIGLKINSVSNIKSPKYITDILYSHNIDSKGLLVDVSNYSLYLYGQPTHCFDSDNIDGNIIIRFATYGEKFIALDDKEYNLGNKDIVIADNSKILALAGIIGAKNSAVSDSTKSIIVESACFNHEYLRKTGKRLGIRTDALNIFEKDILPSMQKPGVSLIAKELETNIKGLTFESYSDIYDAKQEEVLIDYDLGFFNRLIGRNYLEKDVSSILNNLSIEKQGDKLKVPFWRKDLEYKGDIAEEIARIDGYYKVEPTVPRINLGAVNQDNIYNIKNDALNFFVGRGFFDLYNYSFVNSDLMKRSGGVINDLVPLKNSLSEDLTHMRGSLIPNLLQSLEKNILDFKELKVFEIDKVFKLDHKEIGENYSLSGLLLSNKDLAYYDIQNVLSDLFKFIGVDNYYFGEVDEVPFFAHSGRTSSVVVRGKIIGYVGEIRPKIANNFGINNRIGFFDINLDQLSSNAYCKIKAKEISLFQENNFDLNFVVDKNVAGKDIKIGIENTDKNLINRVELFDIYENKEKLPGKRSLSFKIFIQSQDGTLDDKVKGDLINNIVEKLKKKGAELR